MTESTTNPDFWQRFKPDKAWIAIALIFGAVAVLVPADLLGVGQDTVISVMGTAPFILFAVFMVAYLKATGAEGIVAEAFKGSPARMVVLAALVGGIAPFCSCEVIPFVAALLAMGVPLAAVMAFWLSSPIMDPPMFIITSAALGVDFAIAKTIAAVAFGLFGGFVVMAFSRTALFTDPLRPDAQGGGCGCSANPFTGKPVWRFWQESDRLTQFKNTAAHNLVFLLKWLTLAYTVEAVMVRYVPAEWIANILGGEGFGPILLGALVGGPAYLNGYAAAPLVGGLIDQGMSQGAAMSFMMAGSVSCIPAAIAVWAIVKPKVFAAYISFGFTGSLMAGLLWAAWI
ncbi:permease [Neptunicoccus sediminis]|uniref:permease n=1 Tax=Neptunicoccus sediminis TaxID=1892596 RepID=UPI000845D28F|nr:permease [Neptunicoccus sediminis]